MRWRAAFGAVAAGALALAFVPSVLASVAFVPSVLAVVASDAVVVGLGALAVAAGLVGLYGTRPAAPPDGDDGDPTAATERLGSSPDGQAAAAVGFGGPPWTHDRTYVDETFRRALARPDVGVERNAANRSYYRREARSTVTETAVGVLSRRYDVDESEAAAMIREGRWTDAPRAAAFLESSVRLPLRLRLVDWAYGARYRRGLEAVVREIERLAGEDYLEDADATVVREGDEPVSGRGDGVAGATDYGREEWTGERAGAGGDETADASATGGRQERGLGAVWDAEGAESAAPVDADTGETTDAAFDRAGSGGGDRR